MTRPLASLSLDLDNQWSYMKTHGDEGWQSYPGYLDRVVPRFLDFFERRGTRLTVFVVGQDAALPRNHAALKSIADHGHEIGNHSFHHEPWLHLYSGEELLEEFRSSEAAIVQATGQRPRGFRGPGFSFSGEVLNLLAARGYLYDASTFPTFLGPLARGYYFFRSRLSRQEKQERRELFGRFSEGFRPNKPFIWNIGQRQLLEIPVTTMPVFRLPIHASYLCYLAGYSGGLARFYFRRALQLCRWAAVRPSFLLHPLDFLDVTDVPELAYFPAMKMPAGKKAELLNDCLDMLEKHWQPVPLQQQAEAALEQSLAQREIPVALS